MKPTAISKEKLEQIEAMLPEVSDKIREIPHMLLMGAIVENEDMGWIHNNIEATSSELIMMFAELMKRDSGMIDILTRAIKIALDEGAHANSPDESIVESGEGSISDVDNLLNDILDVDDEEGDK